MARPKPGEKTPGSGRQKGTPNKKTLTLIQQCEEMGVDPFGILLKHCMDSDKAISMAAAKEVCQYILPKRRSLEHSGSLDPKLMEAAEEVASLNKEQQIELLETELKRLKGE